jgi:hypothetical protein
MLKNHLRSLIVKGAVLSALGLQTSAVAAGTAEQGGDSGAWNGFSYGKNGLQFESADGNNFLWFGVRLQTRYSNEKLYQDYLPGNPIERQTEVAVNRGRLKLGG